MEVPGSALIPPTPLGRQDGEEATSGVIRSHLDRDSLVVKVLDCGNHVRSSSPIPLKIRCLGERCMLNLSRAQTSSRWCGVVVRKRGCHGGERGCHLTTAQNYEIRRQKPSGS
ncbi:uncharacterized protein TNCV_1380581 [Trichonephila clavipes]|nr:uncharacterized protein TNCV_1380581 [Trichonephila clavipes]